MNLYFHKQELLEISQMKCMLFHYLVIHSVTTINKPNEPRRQSYVKVINKSTNTSCETCSDYLKKQPVKFLWYLYRYVS